MKNGINFEFSNSKNTKDIIKNNIIIASSDYYNFHKKSIPRNVILAKTLTIFNVKSDTIKVAKLIEILLKKYKIDALTGITKNNNVIIDFINYDYNTHKTIKLGTFLYQKNLAEDISMIFESKSVIERFRDLFK